MKQTLIYCITLDEKLVKSLQTQLAPRFCLHIESILKTDLAGQVNSILGLDTGKIGPEIIVLDARLLSLQNSEEVINSILGAGIGLFVFEKNAEPEIVWTAAKAGAQRLVLEQVNDDFDRALKLRKYDHETLELENEFAEVYDAKELASAATLSAILWENEYTLGQLKSYLKDIDHPIRILDLGCGTGRFEEIVSLDEEISAKIESIHAVDFAPMYLKKAKERLAHFLPSHLLNRIAFKRRIAEQTRLPSDYFDVVIASFGVVCFSQFHLTVPEIHRMLKPSGLVILNGYNRNALSYEFNELLKDQPQAKSLFTANIDREKNEMRLGEKVMHCSSFSVSELEMFLKLWKFKPKLETAQTFPTLYGCARKDYLSLLHPVNTPNIEIKQPVVSYQSAHLEKDVYKSGFSPVLHKMDLDLTQSLKNRGFYFAITAHK